MDTNLILVSAYINIESIEKSEKRQQTFPFYQERGQKLINLPIQKIIFIDVNYIDQFQANEHTILLPITLEELDIYPYYQRIMEPSNGISCLSPNPVKDTVLYHIIQIAKTEFVSRAINLYYTNDFKNINKESIFGWIDFGISKMFKSNEEFTTTICTLPSRIKELQTTGHWQPNTVKIPGCWNLNPMDNSEIDMIRWYFCGGFFLGGKEVLQKFEKEVKKELKSILDEHKKIIFEVNIWFRIWKRGGMDIDWYWGDHNASMMLIS